VGKHTCKLNIGQELSSGMKRNKTAVIPADDYLPSTHNVEEVIGKLTFDRQMFIEKGYMVLGSEVQGSRVKKLWIHYSTCPQCLETGVSQLE
jgi:hypothetical protein